MIETTQKIIRIGSSEGVTLPKKELDQLGVKRGDLVKLKVEPATTPNRQEDLMREYQEFVKIYGQTLKNLADKWQFIT